MASERLQGAPGGGVAGPSRLVRAVSAWTVLHLVVNVVHGLVHGPADVALRTWQTAFVTIVTFVGPSIAVLLARHRPAAGRALFLATMSATLIFEVLHHFVLDTVDRVDQVHGTWRPAFAVTAAVAAVVDAAGVAVVARLRPDG